MSAKGAGEAAVSDSATHSRGTENRKILILFAHPALQKSRANRYLLLATKNLNDVTVHDLYEEYPDFFIDVEREKALLLEHDVIIFQHPFFWYSSPAILKEWEDLVLEFGFAYGTGGTALHGKLFLNAITTGGPQEAYRREGYNHFTIRELLRPFEQTARLCGMHYLPPFIVHGTVHVKDEEQFRQSADEYRRVLIALQKGQFAVDQIRDLPQLSSETLALER